MTRLDACLAFTLRPDIEGGWSDDPHDPGGATMRGVTLAVFRAWRHNPAATSAQLHAITAAELMAIYAALYWQPCRCGDLPAGIDLMVFDQAVNSGVRRSGMLLQEAALVLPADGWIGPATIRAVQGCGGLLDRLAAGQGAFYRSLPGFPRFGRGWLTRLDKRVAAARGATDKKSLQVGADPVVKDSLSTADATDALNAASLARARGP